MSSTDPKYRVLVTPRSFGADDPALRDELLAAVGDVLWRQEGNLGTGELADAVAEADGWIAGVERIDRTVIEAAPRLRVIARYGVGVANVDLRAAADRGITVTNTPGANSAAVAELVIGMVFALARRIAFADAEVRRGRWPRIRGIAVEGKTVGLLGFGAIGREVGRRARSLGCRVLAFDPAPVGDAAAAAGVELAPREEVVATSDFLSLHVPVTGETEGMVDAAFLARMKRGSHLINAARGELVDEAALVDALRAGHLAGAALDSLAVEPPAAGFALGQLDQVVLTPHVGAHTDAAAAAMGRAAVANCLAVLRGEPVPNPVAAPAEVPR
ncbi:MAG: phosphoglycerate dehydrogenase [Solirubrobacterales bacterium]